MKRRRRIAWWVAISAAAIGTTVGISVRAENSSAIFSKYQQEMNLAKLHNLPAANFTLTDESGKELNLSDYRGKAVILTFLDPECTDVCPIISAEFVEAAKELGSANRNVEFIGVNVNTYHRSNAELSKFSRDHGLSKLPNWHFVSGTPSQLARVWKAYGVYVKQNPTGDVVHSDYIYFIDPKGNERYIAASATNSKTPIAQWGSGIAYYVNSLMAS